MSLSPKTTKWLGALLLASLALNFFVGGLIAARALGPKYERGPGGPRPHIDFNLREIAKALPEEERKAIRDNFRAKRKDMAPVHREMRATRDELGRLFAAEEVDEAAIRAAFERLRTLGVRLQTPVHETMINLALTLPHETRVKIIERRREFGRRHDRPMRGRHPPPQPSEETADGGT